MSKLYNVGIYVRLSVEDAKTHKKHGNPFDTESASIENQKTILREYAHLRGWNIVRIYADDGFSGGNYNRPAFLEMFEDAKAGLINLILVKDLSRLGRDYIETGRYTEEVFPELGVRFIALMDDIDSEGNDDLLPFRSLLNDYHLKDLSRKIKTTFRAKAERGDYAIAYAPYGYRKNSDNPNRLAVHEATAEIVRRIFTMRSQGGGYGKIAAALNREGFLIPRESFYELEGKTNPCNNRGSWCGTTVRHILGNEVYLGHSVKFKQGTLSYKNKQRVTKPADELIRCENTHTAIISQELWNAAQAVSASRRTQDSETREKALFSRILQCADCGAGFDYSTANRVRANGNAVIYRSYTCRQHVSSGRSRCSSHTISELALLKIVRDDINLHLEQFNGDTVINEIRLSETSVADTKRELTVITNRLSELETLCAKLYEDRLDGTIDLGTFKAISANIEEERAGKQDKRDKLALAIAEAEEQTVSVQNWLESIQEFLSFEQPARETLAALIDRIEVGENEGTRGKRRQSIRILYRFAGELRESNI
jgi:DNA invertase Pin-like site-specific DNA recombinase